MKVFSLWVLSFFVTAFFYVVSASELHFIDVGQGNCTLVKFINAPPLIVDSGSSQLRGVDEDEKSEFKRQTVSSIRSRTERFVSSYKKTPDLNIIVSHAHTDHYNLIQPIFANKWMEKKDVRFLLGGKKEDYCTEESRKLLDVVHRYQPSPAKVFVRDFASETDISNFGYSTDVFKILMAPHAGFDTANLNDRSIVIRLHLRVLSCILTGDAVGTVTDAILLKYATTLGELDSVVYQACHHGSDRYESNDEVFIGAIAPECTVFSSGQKHKHPSSKVVKRVLPHATDSASGKYHILRYNHRDDGVSGDLVDGTDAGKKIVKKGDLQKGYILGVTKLKIFNTQDQRTIEFKNITDTSYVISHDGLLKDTDDFSPADVDDDVWSDSSDSDGED